MPKHSKPVFVNGKKGEVGAFDVADMVDAATRDRLLENLLRPSLDAAFGLTDPTLESLIPTEAP